ncbi:hypothetical protein SLEP1_g27393 [Rubroshorea leprosula]|uniref:Uncharacterized protein n=1 Tax=Rubroshorea leprosula TaxID=152421 RepID=A0AAV5K120_9ROSI|nr:hypothetical protein SLEP1_g27393 [Rubroshorea leprosula]
MEFYAMAGMLEFWRSLLRQSKPSTLTAAGLRPYFILTHPPLRVADDGDDKPDGDGICSDGMGVSLSSPKRASCTSGLAALLGGDPQKNGGDEATGVTGGSVTKSSCITPKILVNQ